MKPSPTRRPHTHLRPPLVDHARASRGSRPAIAPGVRGSSVLRPLGPASEALTTGEFVENQSCAGWRLTFW